jgi:hypothetical protein
MRLARISLALLAFACSESQQPVGDAVVIAQALTTNAQITRVTVTVTPANVTSDLTRNPDGTFGGTVVVPVGTHTVTVEAFVGIDKVGTGTASVTVTKGAHLQALITILDATGPQPGPDHSPVVTSLVARAIAQLGDTFTLTATAEDADGDAMTFS